MKDTDNTQEVKSVSTMVRLTGENTQKFLEQVALHIENLENEIIKLNEIIKQTNEAK